MNIQEKNMFERLEGLHEQVYGAFRGTRRGACECRSGKEHSYVVRMGELGCERCLR